MSAYSVSRTWTATLEDGTPLPWSEYDLLKDQTDTAVREVIARGLLSGDESVSVVLFKNTKAHGLRRDRSVRVETDKRGAVRVSGPYA